MFKHTPKQETDLNQTIVEEVERPFHKLQLGSLQNEIIGNPTFVSRLELRTALVKHTGCVNTIQWNSNGSLLISGSDDCRLNIWSAGQSYKLQHSLFTGHRRNIFSAVFVPGTNDHKVVSTGMDGEVYYLDLFSHQSISK